MRMLTYLSAAPYITQSAKRKYYSEKKNNTVFFNHRSNNSLNGNNEFTRENNLLLQNFHDVCRLQERCTLIEAFCTHDKLYATGS